jgi:excisionase family DNA binding protein
MKTIHLDSLGQLSLVTDAIRELLNDGKHVAITVVDKDELLSPNQVADRLGFSRQHVRRLIDAGEIEATQMPGSSHWKVPAASVIAFEKRREQAREQADEFSRELDRHGAPLE